MEGFHQKLETEMMLSQRASKALELIKELNLLDKESKKKVLKIEIEESVPSKTWPPKRKATAPP